jgi:rhodanese-related sulfurtransferase
MEKSFSERVAEAKQAVTSISPAQAAELRGANGVLFVDPRPADAIAKSTGIIPGALNVLLGDIAGGNLPGPLADRSTHVITSCQGGPMAAIAAHELTKLGFARVNYIDGGTQGWLDAGLPTNR